MTSAELPRAMFSNRSSSSYVTQNKSSTRKTFSLDGVQQRFSKCYSLTCSGTLYEHFATAGRAYNSSSCFLSIERYYSRQRCFPTKQAAGGDATWHFKATKTIFGAAIRDHNWSNERTELGSPYYTSVPRPGVCFWLLPIEDGTSPHGSRYIYETAEIQRTPGQVWNTALSVRLRSRRVAKRCTVRRSIPNSHISMCC